MFKLISSDNIFPIYDKKIKELVQDFSKDQLDEKDVHRIRINIRGIRIFLRILRDIDNSPKYIQLNKVLKNAFKQLEYTRKLTVFKKALQEIPLNKNYIAIIKGDIKTENKKALKQLNLIKHDLSKTLMNFEFNKIDDNGLQIAFEKQIFLYKINLKNVNLNSMESIHDLRISGKMFKYLIDDDIIQVSDQINNQETEIYKYLSNLHSCIGDLHDLDENKILFNQYFPKKKTTLPKETQKIVKNYFLENKKREEKQLGLLISHTKNLFI
jgi:CHAD domain-containing protein